jgi:hypothetical protein
MRSRNLVQVGESFSRSTVFSVHQITGQKNGCILPRKQAKSRFWRRSVSEFMRAYSPAAHTAGYDTCEQVQLVVIAEIILGQPKPKTAMAWRLRPSQYSFGKQAFSGKSQCAF